MKNKKRFRNFGKILLMVALMIIFITGLVAIEFWLTDWLGFAGYALSIIVRILAFLTLIIISLPK